MRVGKWPLNLQNFLERSGSWGDYTKAMGGEDPLE